MTLNELRYVAAVAREKNFRRAAERCFVSQPALSLAIRKLENELGVQIFERGRTKVALTANGVRIVEQAQRALDEVARIREIAQAGKDPLAGALRLGVIHTVGPYLLPELIPVLQKLAPRMPLEVEEDVTANLETGLKNGRLDAIVVALPLAGPGVATRALYDEAFEVVVPRAHAWAKRPSVKASELAGERVLLLDVGHCFSDQVVDTCPELLQRGDRQQGNSLETIRNMVASGLGVTVLPASANEGKYRSPLTRVVPFARPEPKRRIGLAWRRAFARPQAIDALVEAVRAVRLPGLQIVRR